MPKESNPCKANAGGQLPWKKICGAMVFIFGLAMKSK
jgi:hypothetical protein